MFVSNKCHVFLTLFVVNHLSISIVESVRYGLHKAMPTSPPPSQPQPPSPINNNQSIRMGMRSEQFNNAMNAYNLVQDKINNRVDSDNIINTVMLICEQKELPVYYEILKPTLEIAAAAAKKIFTHLDFRLKFIRDNNTCEENVLGALGAQEFFTSRVNVFIGPICSTALDQVARMASYWNVPVFTAGGIGWEFGNKRVFSTLTRVSFSLDRISHFLVKIFREYDWHHISLIVDETEPVNTLLKESMKSIFKQAEFGYEILLDIQSFHRNDANVTINHQRLLRQSSKAARVIILCTTGELTRHFMMEAHDAGMTNGDYAFFGIELIKTAGSQNDFSWYKAGDRRNKIAKQAYESLFLLALRVPVTKEFDLFVLDAVKRSSEEFKKIVTKDEINPLVAAFYDCFMMFAWSYNATLAEGRNVTDGRLLVRRLWGRTFPMGLTGDITLNDNGDREVDYTLNDFNPENNMMRPIASYFGARRTMERIPGIEVHWPKDLGPPMDVPVCGFSNDSPSCLPKESFPVWATILIVFAIVSIIVLAVSIMLYKKIRLEQQLADNWWKVYYDDIVFANQMKGGHKSAMSLATTVSETDGYASGKTSSLRIGGSVAHSLISAAGELDTVLVGIYKGVKIAYKPLNIKRLELTRQLLLEAKQMRDYVHENLVKFIGMCVDEPNYGVLTELMIRGSLKDLLEADKIQIDWTFKYSMMTDIVEGMLFLHNSNLEYHGHLKSTNCVVDGRFMVKITDYGMRSLHEQITRETDLNSRALFWTAPEHLRAKDPMNSGSKKGDIYAFGIILQEIITRSPPFESLERLGRKKQTYEPNEILDRVRMGTVPPFRPEVAPDECSKELLQLMHNCWQEQPNSRPDFQQIKPMLRKITQGVSSRNFLDNLLNRLETYSQNLERIVEEKTQSVIEEKQKTEELLYQLLPRFIADELKRGSHVKPEAYECVTIFFSDISEFNSITAQSTPMQLVDLLNDLYTCFDAIIDIHDVYKVETIGDAYMIASGLPIRNGNDHARFISSMALDLRKAIAAFRIRHMPKRKLQIRIGIHSGPVVAGVVGLKMPKYCLFGDTVNTASRMESHGEPQKIHISESTKCILDTFPNTFIIAQRGEVEIKGKGTMVTYWLEGERKGITPYGYSHSVDDYNMSKSTPTMGQDYHNFNPIGPNGMPENTQQEATLVDVN